MAPHSHDHPAFTLSLSLSLSLSVVGIPSPEEPSLLHPSSIFLCSTSRNEPLTCRAARCLSALPDSLSSSQQKGALVIYSTDFARSLRALSVCPANQRRMMHRRPRPAARRISPEYEEPAVPTKAVRVRIGNEAAQCPTETSGTWREEKTNSGPFLSLSLSPSPFFFLSCPIDDQAPPPNFRLGLFFSNTPDIEGLHHRPIRIFSL